MEKDKNVEESEIWKDERFQHLIKDPRFKNLPKKERKVKIDKRFQSMFTDDKFKVKYTVDKYGRHINKSNAEDLRKFYELDSEDEEKESNERHKEELAISQANLSHENDELESDGEEIPQSLRQRLCDPSIDYARGDGRIITDSSSDDTSSSEEEEEDDDDLINNVDHVWGELDGQADMTEESTHRLAACNMDWDRMRAVDLMVLLSSFLPPGGSILSVKIYPSEYGKKRMAEEEHHGPPELVGLSKEGTKKDCRKYSSDTEDDEEELLKAQDSEAEEGDDYHMEKLRQYQLNRLRYFYAVVECDSIATADKIYKECDGIEYESSATRVDLRFIPNDTNFDEDKPNDICTELPDSSNYKPRQFTTTALQQVKVDLTWDETAVERKELGEKLSSGKLDEVNDKDLRKIVAYSSEEDEEEEEKKPLVVNKVQDDSLVKNKKENIINKYKALLAEINEKEKEKKHKKYEMEFTWEVNDSKVEKNDFGGEEKQNVKKEDKCENLTPIEKILKKRSEKNKKRKEDRKRRSLLAKGIDPDVNCDSDSDDSVPDGIDMNDAYFAEEFQNCDFVEKNHKKKGVTKKSREELDEEEKEAEKEAQELALLLDDNETGEKNHFSLNKIIQAEQESKSKRKRRRQLKKSKSSIAEEKQELEDNFQLNVNDERFLNLYTSHLYNIDPTNSHFKKTKGMELLIQEKLKRREKNDWHEDKEAKRPKKQIENILLVKSLKRKLQLQQQKQKQ